MLRELNSQHQGNDAMHFNEIRFLEWILNEGVTPESASRSRKKTQKQKRQKKKIPSKPNSDKFKVLDT